MSLHLLLDENAESKWFVNRLKQAGHDVACLKDFLPKGAKDEEVLMLAKKKRRVLYTQDHDFIEVSLCQKNHCGIILEFVSGTPKDMSITQIIVDLAAIENAHTDLRNQIVIVNGWRKN